MGLQSVKPVILMEIGRARDAVWNVHTPICEWRGGDTSRSHQILWDRTGLAS